MADKCRIPNDRRVPVEGHPGIFKKGNRYQVLYRHFGRQKARSCPTLTEAVRFQRKVQAGDTQPTSRRPFKSYALEWLGTYTGRTAKGLSESTRASYKDAIERFAIPFFGTMPLDRIDPPKIRDFISSLAKKGLAPSSVRRIYAPLRALLATAHEDGLLKFNPAAGVRVVVPDSRERKPKWVTVGQTKEVIAATHDAHVDLVWFLATTGVRISEALAARWRDIGQDESGRPSLTIRKSKTAAGERTILLSPGTARRLTKRRSEARFSADDDLIFPSSTGTPIDPHNWRREVFKPAAEKAGVPWATPHKLRHGLASLMASQGLSAAQIAAHLGHADGGVLALRTYVHPHQLDSADFIDQALS